MAKETALRLQVAAANCEEVGASRTQQKKAAAALSAEHSSAAAGEDERSGEADDLTCAICLEQIVVQDLCVVKGCEHVYCGVACRSHSLPRFRDVAPASAFEHCTLAVSTIMSSDRCMGQAGLRSQCWGCLLRRQVHPGLGHAQGPGLVPAVQGALQRAAHAQEAGRQPVGLPGRGVAVPAQALHVVHRPPQGARSGQGGRAGFTATARGAVPPRPPSADEPDARDWADWQDAVERAHYARFEAEFEDDDEVGLCA